MKKIITSIALVMSFCASSAFAASDYYLQIKGSKGDKTATQIVKCPNGACTISSLAPDTYAVSVVDASGNPASLDNVKYECSVVSPRDAASGLATGKRMHKPFVITKELSSSELVATETESNVAITCVSGPTAVVAPATAAAKASYDLKAAKK